MQSSHRDGISVHYVAEIKTCSNFPSFIICWMKEQQQKKVFSAINRVSGKPPSQLKMLSYSSQETPLLSDHVRI